MAALALIGSLAIAKDATEIQSIDGSQRNQITPGSGGGGGGSGTVENVNSSVPWISSSGNGTDTITLSTNATKVALGNLETGIITNLTLVTAPYLSLSGLGTSTITITSIGTVITNNASPTFGTLNGLTPANLVSNISTTVPWLTVTGTSGNSYLFATNATKIPAGNLDTSGFALLNSPNTFTSQNFFLTNWPVFGTNVNYTFTGAPGRSVVLVNPGNALGDSAGYVVVHKTSSDSFYYGIANESNPNLFSRFEMNASSDVDIYLGSSVGSFGVWDDQIAGRAFSITGGNLIYGFNSSSTHTFNGSTLTTAHPLSWNSGVWQIPTSTTGTVTNNAGSGSGIAVSFLNGIIASNVVTRTTDGTAYIDSGTNQLMRIIANNSAGVIQTEGLFTARTNTLTATLPVINAIYTNNGLRMSLNVTAAFAPGGEAGIVSIFGTTTQIFARSRYPIAVTNWMSGNIQPTALYYVSNFAGTVTLRPGEWNETRW